MMELENVGCRRHQRNPASGRQATITGEHRWVSARKIRVRVVKMD